MTNESTGSDVSIGIPGTPGTGQPAGGGGASGSNAPFSGNSDDRGKAPGRNPGSNPDNPGDDPGVREPLAKPDVVAEAPTDPSVAPTESGAQSRHGGSGAATSSPQTLKRSNESKGKPA